MTEQTFSENNNEKTRTLLQNNCLHAYCQEVSDALNEIGITQKVIIDHLTIMDVDTTPHFIKRLFQIIGEAKFGKSETHLFTTKEMGEVEKEVHKLIVEISKGEISPIWPSEENKSFNEQYN